MVAFAFAPTLSVFAVFQFFVPTRAIARVAETPRSVITSHDLAPLFNYYIAWVAHVLISVAVAVGAARSAFRDTSELKATHLKQTRTLAFLISMLVVFVADAMHSNLAVLSHERVFRVLSAEASLAPLFRSEYVIGTLHVFTPTVFSLFPIIAIAAAIWAAATVIMCASKFLLEFHRTGDSLESADLVAAFTAALEELRSHFLALSLVLVTSTFATVAYLRTPLGLLAITERRSQKPITDAVGLVWGVTFSLILIALCVYPFSSLRNRFDALRRDAQFTSNDVLDRWLRKNRVFLQVPANLQLVLSMLLPATVAVLANLVST